MYNQRLVYKLFAFSTGIPVLSLIMTLVPVQEGGVFYATLMMLGMIILPLSKFVAFALVMACTVFAFIIHTKSTALLGVMGFLLCAMEFFQLLSPLLELDNIDFISLYEVDKWCYILINIIFVTSASMYFFTHKGSLSKTEDKKACNS